MTTCDQIKHRHPRGRIRKQESGNFDIRLDGRPKLMTETIPCSSKQLSQYSLSFRAIRK